MAPDRGQSDDVIADETLSPLTITRQFSYPYFYMSDLPHSSSVAFRSASSPPIQFMQLHVGSTENDVTEIPMGSHDNHVTQVLVSCDQPRVHLSDSVPSYHIFSPLPPSHTHTNNAQSSYPPPSLPRLSELASDALLKEYASDAHGLAESTGEDIHQRDFENGRIDYTGSDRFESIQERIDSKLGQ